MENKLKIDVYVLCYNEKILTPFVLDYWNKFATNVYIYDNESNDGCLDLFKQETRFNLEIRNYVSNNKIDNIAHLNIKNNEWKQSKGKADFVVVSDFDEVIYHPNILDEFKKLKENGDSICHTKYFETYAEHYPAYNGELLHKLIPVGVYGDYGKTIIFDPNKIEEIGYTPGAHTFKPKGNIKYCNSDINMIHFKWIDMPYLYNKHQEYLNRRCDNDIKEDFGSHYKFSLNELMRIYNDGIKNSVIFKE